ncbi:TRAP transporter permease, partial [Cribrihabitans sp. XS_ASV171]
IAGALLLGFLVFAAYNFSQDDGDDRETPMLTMAGYLLLVPVAIAFWTVLQFIGTLNSGELPEMGGLVTWPAFAGTEIYAKELWWFGTPLLIATFGAILLSWFERRGRGALTASDLVLALCGIVVAVYLIP